MNPKLLIIGHQHFDLFRNIFIWKHDHKATQFIYNNLEQFYIQSEDWLENLLDLFDAFYSFGLDIKYDLPFHVITFDPNYIETRHTLTFENCQKLGILKTKHKTMKWTQKHNELISEWIYCNTNENEQILTRNIVNRCIAHPHFKIFSQQTVIDKLVKFWSIMKYVVYLHLFAF